MAESSLSGHRTGMDIFYSPRMVAPSESYSPSAEKPAQVVESWKRLGLPLTLREPAAVTPEQLALAHDRKFVDGVLACKRVNGFNNRSKRVAETLPLTT